MAAVVPQWDLLDLLATEASRWAGFTLRQGWEVVDLVGEPDGRVGGVVARDHDGTEHRVTARLTIGADGRGSVVREQARLPLRRFGAPIDVLWFRLPLAAGDPEHVTLRVTAGAMAVLIRRETHWQCGLVTPKGRAAELLRDDAAPLGERLGRMTPWLAARAAEVRPADAHLLDVRLDRLRRWWRPGLLCLGDAAHAMSPVAGVGINLAVQDAVAAANRLAGPLAEGRDPAALDRLLAGVQRLRLPVTAVTQGMQQLVHARLLRPVSTAAAGHRRRCPARCASSPGRRRSSASSGAWWRSGSGRSSRAPRWCRRCAETPIGAHVGPVAPGRRGMMPNRATESADVANMRRINYGLSP